MTKKSAGLTGAGLLGMALGLYLFLYRPIMGELKIHSGECRRLETEAAEIRSLVFSFKAKETVRNFVAEKEAALAIDEFTRLGKLKGIKFIAMTPREIEKRDGSAFKILPIEMEIEANYEKWGPFLGALEELEQSLVTVESFALVPKLLDSSKIKAKLVVHMHLAD